MSIIVKSGNSTNTLTVNSNKQALVNPTLTPVNAGFVSLVAEADAGSIMGERTTYALEENEDFNIRFGVDNLYFYATFNGSAVYDYNKWIYTYSAVQVIGQANGFFTLNNNAAVTNGLYGTMTSYQSFHYKPTQSFYVQYKAKIEKPNTLNAIAELGFGILATTAAPSDGIFFRWGLGGTLNGIVNFAGVETIGKPIPVPTDSETHYYCITVTWDSAEFWIDDVLQDKIYCPQADAQPTRGMSFPLVARMYNSGVASDAMKVNIASIVVAQGAHNKGRSFAAFSSSAQRNAHQGDQTWTALNLQNNWTNSGAQGAATLANNATPSGGYTGSTLGGIFRFNSVVAATTDLVVFNYPVTTGSSSVEAKSLFITDVCITTSSEGAAFDASAPTVLQWALGFGSTATTLATPDATTSRAPRIFPLGTQSFPVSSARGTSANAITMTLGTPIKVDPGTYLHVIAQEILGTNTSSLYYRGCVYLGGYFE